ncbi:NAD(P)-dependent oxidoreductase [Geomicrobium sp. JCM 19038]|uniref:NAD(P)-dependent oxidoreductase n=1 Tax=Geomicrobium sp. JCM 19038 TaxID=1460635 RepID=UPI00045F4274|nr:SDR family oxidoreductase [Geomicrobium sp. JCM 19038]GAK09212.1 oxidoreductase [Geomicrobium sp. JCM 19038]
MNCLLLGATGRVGSHVVNHALKENHYVTLLVRTPENVQSTHENLTIINGNVLNKADITRAMKGMDFVISALNTDGSTTLSQSMPLIIDAMKEEGVRRIITVGTAGILQSRSSPELLRYQSSESKRKLTRAAEDHHRAYEWLKTSGLDWTIVCPTYLPDGEYTGQYRVERDFLPEEGAKISVPDTAEFTWKQVDCDQYIGARVGIAY